MVHLRSLLTGSLPPTRLFSARRAGPAMPSLGTGTSTPHDLSHSTRTRSPKRVRHFRTPLASRENPAAIHRAGGDVPGGEGQATVGFQGIRGAAGCLHPCHRFVRSPRRHSGTFARVDGLAHSHYRPMPSLVGPGVASAAQSGRVSIGLC
jgi:hypothetical protein